MLYVKSTSRVVVSYAAACTRAFLKPPIIWKHLESSSLITLQANLIRYVNNTERLQSVQFRKSFIHASRQCYYRNVFREQQLSSIKRLFVLKQQAIIVMFAYVREAPTWSFMVRGVPSFSSSTGLLNNCNIVVKKSIVIYEPSDCFHLLCINDIECL